MVVSATERASRTGRSPWKVVACGLLTCVLALGVAGSAAQQHAGPSPPTSSCSHRGPGSGGCRDDEASESAAGAVATITPAQLRDAYGLASARGHGRTVAIVAAFGYPHAERDLAVFRAEHRLPACTTASGCLRIVNEAGGPDLPSFDPYWAREQALDMSAVSAACPDCKILLVQAERDSIRALGPGVTTAARTPGVVAISNSYTFGDLDDRHYGKYFDHPDVVITAATGDYGHGPSVYPASSRHVIAVGGTTLKRSSSGTGWDETAWAGSGSGCFPENEAPSETMVVVTGCSGRASADVSAVADPATGLMIFAPVDARHSQWTRGGGTSMAAPIVAAVAAMAAEASPDEADAGHSSVAALYRAPGSAFRDVTSGTNGTCEHYCSAGPGWDGPTGLGSPRGLAAFRRSAG